MLSKLLLILLVIFLTMHSCNNQIAGDKTNEDNSVLSENSTEKKPSAPFEISNILYQGFESRIENGDSYEYKISFNIKNETGNRITIFDIKAFLEAQFSDEQGLDFYPNDQTFSERYRTEERYIKDQTFPQPPKDVEINSNKPWLSGEEKTFTFSIYNDIDWAMKKVWFSKNIFERTPQKLEFVYKYKAISIDGEYTDIKRYDMLDTWKSFQTQLGLR